MKKIAWLAAVVLLAGCSGEGNETETTETQSSVAETTETVESESSEESSMEVSSEIEDTATESLPEESSSEESVAQGETTDLTLHIPTALTQDEGTPIYEDVLGVADEFIAQNAQLGEETLFTLSYTGYYIENTDGGLQAYFMGINRTGEPLKDLTFNLNFVVDGTAIWEDTEFTLAESEFGEQPVNTTMPIFLDVPPGMEELLMSSTPENTLIEITNLEMP